MNIVLYIAAVIAILSTVMVITRLNAVHALLYLILSLLALAVVFFVLGAPFVAALEVIIYAGAIMVLFVFVIMMLNLGPQATGQEQHWFRLRQFILPGVLAVLLLVETAYAVIFLPYRRFAGGGIEPLQVSRALFGPYLLGVELSSILLLAGLVAAYHLGQRQRGRESARQETKDHVMSR